MRRLRHWLRVQWRGTCPDPLEPFYAFQIREAWRRNLKRESLEYRRRMRGGYY